ncbi:hypothetical protein [Streptomyces chromofuscus]|uniref:hypothetical protein n=1 Tax=Streptomyces chromofuscus TaxID=42881 RepID=UPI0019C8749A|nr:hypothetical protein [Streptomyces chromofuscus]GGT04533.1 hypothetical protein GCM10010254_26220 [Streptomyces chromofuscus]
MPARQHTPTARTAAAWRLALLFFAVGQVISPVFNQIAGTEFTTADRAGEPPIVPVGWAFAIWSLVEVLCLAYAVWALPEHRPDIALRSELAVPLTVAFAGFSCWLVAAEAEPVWATVVIFAIMVAALLKALRIALRQRHAIAAWPRLPRHLLWWTLGIYTGWSTMAVWINFTTAMAGSGAPTRSTAAVAAQLAVLAGATATAVVIVRWTRGLLPYALAACWALLTAGLGAAQAGEPVLAAGAATGFAITAASTFRARRQPGTTRQRASAGTC